MKKGGVGIKLLFKQRFFSWFDSYDIFNEAGETVYTVKGQLAWGHCLKVFDADGRELGTVKEKIFTWLPKFEIWMDGEYVGCICKEFTLFKPRFTIDYSGWQVQGEFLEWDYRILDPAGAEVAVISKQFGWTDTYEIDVHDPRNALQALMLVLAIDAEKCSRQSHNH